MNKHMCLRLADQHVCVWVRDGSAVMVKVMFVCVCYSTTCAYLTNCGSKSLWIRINNATESSNLFGSEQMALSLGLCVEDSTACGRWCDLTCTSKKQSNDKSCNPSHSH